MRTLVCRCRKPGHPADMMDYTVFVNTIEGTTKFGIYQNGPWFDQPQHARAEAELTTAGVTFTSGNKTIQVSANGVA